MCFLWSRLWAPKLSCARKADGHTKGQAIAIAPPSLGGPLGLAPPAQGRTLPRAHRRGYISSRSLADGLPRLGVRSLPKEAHSCDCNFAILQFCNLKAMISIFLESGPQSVMLFCGGTKKVAGKKAPQFLGSHFLFFRRAMILVKTLSIDLKWILSPAILQFTGYSLRIARSPERRNIPAIGLDKNINVI